MANLKREIEFPKDYNKKKVDSRTKIRSSMIRDYKAARYGGDIREAMADGVDISSVIATEANDSSKSAKLIANDTQNRFDAQINGQDKDNESKDARVSKADGKTYNTLKDRLDAMDKKPQQAVDDLEKSLNVTGVDGGIPDYMIDTLSSTQAKIDKSKFNLVFVTDSHYDIGSTYNSFGGDSPDNIQAMWEAGLRKVLNATSLSNADAVVFNGDNIDEPDAHHHRLEKKMMKKQMKDFFKTASSSAKIPAFIIKGNHDQNYHHASYYSATDHKNPDSVISDDELEQIYQDNVADFGEVRNGNSNYFYKDFPEKKIRLIGLDSYDLPEGVNEDDALKFNRFRVSGFRQAQLNWLANTALQVPDDTAVVITMHHPVDGTLTSDPRVINHDVLFQILSDFVEGKTNSVSGKNSDVPVKVNYTFSGAGTIAAVLSGHYHIDGSNIMDGINFIQTRCSLTAGDNMIGKKRWDYFGTKLEDAFDVVSIDTTAKTIDLKRVGAGSEDARFATRHFNY